MRSVLAKLVLVAVMLVGTGLVAASPVLADGNMGPMVAGDGRYNPQVGDRLALYLSDSGVDVWGIDSNNNGFHLTSFTAAEFQSGKTISHTTDQGTVTLRKLSSATSHTGFTDDTATTLTTIIDVSAVYTITWRGGAYGADGSANFEKTLWVNY